MDLHINWKHRLDEATTELVNITSHPGISMRVSNALIGAEEFQKTAAKKIKETEDFTEEEKKKFIELIANLQP